MYLHLILREDAPRQCGDDHMAKSRNRKLICVTSSYEGVERYLHQISGKDASRPCGANHVTKGRNWKLIIRVKSSDGVVHKCIEQIFEPNSVQSSSTTLPTRTYVPNTHNLKIQHGGGRHIE